MRRLLRLLGATLLIAVAVAGAVYLADRPGSVAIQWNGYSAHPTVAKLVLAAFVLFAILALFLWLLRALVGTPGAFVRRRRDRRRRDGYRALSQGMVAVAAGDAEEARRLARKADALLAEPPLTLLLQAQSAQLDGDETAARAYFHAMRERRETEFLGLRGLLMQALRSGDEAAALPLAERAHALRPKAAWPLRQLADLQARAGRWNEAEATLERAVKRRALPAPEGRRFRAALLLERSRAAAASGDPRAAMTLAGRARDADPSLGPAAAWHATLLRDAGQPRQAARALESAWRLAPEPALAAVHRSLAPQQGAVPALKHAQKLAAGNPEHLESLLLLAEAALKARLWGEARRHLAKAGIEDAGIANSARGCRLMAEIEESEHGNSAAARQWLARAAAVAVLDPTYVCSVCGAESAEWTALCQTCRSFAGIAWQHPARAPRQRLESVGVPDVLAPAEAFKRPSALLASWPRLGAAKSEGR